MAPLQISSLFSGPEAHSWQLGSRGPLAAREATGQDAQRPSLPGASGIPGSVQLYIPERACDLTIEHAQGAVRHNLMT